MSRYIIECPDNAKIDISKYKGKFAMGVLVGEIIRCRDCKRANHELSGVRCGLSDVLMGEDGFCSIGEREDDDR